MTKSPSLKRPEHVRVMVAMNEKLELQKAADCAGMGLSVFIRAMALAAARRAHPDRATA